MLIFDNIWYHYFRLYIFQLTTFIFTEFKFSKTEAIKPTKEKKIKELLRDHAKIKVKNE